MTHDDIVYDVTCAGRSMMTHDDIVYGLTCAGRSMMTHDDIVLSAGFLHGAALC
jgi:hypothetical protein